MLDETYFTLDLIHTDGEEKVPAIRHFGLLTALDAPVEIVWEDASFPMKKGETFYIPTMAPALKVRGKGLVALSMPK